jgi:hypothetical protein
LRCPKYFDGLVEPHENEASLMNDDVSVLVNVAARVRPG